MGLVLEEVGKARRGEGKDVGHEYGKRHGGGLGADGKRMAG